MKKYSIFIFSYFLISSKGEEISTCHSFDIRFDRLSPLRIYFKTLYFELSIPHLFCHVLLSSVSPCSFLLFRSSDREMTSALSCRPGWQMSRDYAASRFESFCSDIWMLHARARSATTATSDKHLCDYHLYSAAKESRPRFYSSSLQNTRSGLSGR